MRKSSKIESNCQFSYCKNTCRVKFKGCYEQEPAVATCTPDMSAVDASSAVTYRHFAVDEKHNIVYFCDMAPKGTVNGKLRCFASNRHESQSTKTFDGEFHNMYIEASAIIDFFQSCQA